MLLYDAELQVWTNFNPENCGDIILSNSVLGRTRKKNFRVPKMEGLLNLISGYFLGVEKLP